MLCVTQICSKTVFMKKTLVKKSFKLVAVASDYINMVSFLKKFLTSRILFHKFYADCLFYERDIENTLNAELHQ